MTTPDVVVDSPIGTLLATVTACVCAKLRSIGRPACDCCLDFGADVMAMDGCDCTCDDDEATGRVTGRVLQIGPAPSNVIDTTSTCHTAAVQVTLQVGVFRCVELSDDGSAPTCAQATAEALGFLRDEQAMRAAVSCCPELRDIPGKWRLTPGLWQPHGPSGGCAGGVISVQATGLITFPKETT
ncbi:hypothetical protein ACIRLA_46430 [Streptomyces sp. NPDC102364]|uniref:hypothetical protein n=1 Tax=Streptomyces sp. NPDC102364 TaxID=3366161 RepID=UPI00382C517C